MLVVRTTLSMVKNTLTNLSQKLVTVNIYVVKNITYTANQLKLHLRKVKITQGHNKLRLMVLNTVL
jgi:hypothetical protein